ncbi:MAG: hypothetical protein Q9187_000965 [Circinaria calcarea]
MPLVDPNGIETPQDLQTVYGRPAKRRRTTEPPVVQSIENDEKNPLVTIPKSTGKITTTSTSMNPFGVPHNGLGVSILPSVASSNGVSVRDVMPRPRANNSSNSLAVGELMTKASANPRVVYLIQMMATGQASPAEIAEFGRHTNVLGSTLQIPGDTPMTNDRNQGIADTVQTLSGTLNHEKDVSQPSNFNKSSLYGPQTRELSPPYSPPLEVGFRKVQSHTDAAVQVDIKLKSPGVMAMIDDTYKNGITKSTEDQKPEDSASCTNLAVCGRCGKKVIGATSQGGTVRLCSICKRNGNHAYAEAAQSPYLTNEAANQVVIPESPPPLFDSASRNYAQSKTSTNIRVQPSWGDLRVPGAGLFATHKRSQAPLRANGAQGRNMDGGHYFVEPNQKAPASVSADPRRPNSSGSPDLYSLSMTPSTSYRAKPKDSPSIKSNLSDKLLGVNKERGEVHDLVKSQSSHNLVIAAKAPEPSEIVYRARNLELKKKLKSYEKDIKELRDLLKQRKSEHLKQRDKHKRELGDLHLQLDELREELEKARSKQETIIQSQNTASLTPLSELKGMRKAYRRQEEVLRHRLSQLKDAKSEIEVLRLQISTRERSDQETEIAKLRGQVEELKKRIPHTSIPQWKQGYCHRDLFAAAPELHPDRLLFDAEAKKAEIANRPPRKAQFGSVLANIRKERGIFPHREKNRHVEEGSRTDRGVAIVIERREPSELTSDASDRSFNPDDRSAGSSTSEAILIRTGAAGSNHEALREHDEMMGIPKVAIPCLVDKQLAYRDGTRVSKMRLRPCSAYHMD